MLRLFVSAMLLTMQGWADYCIQAVTLQDFTPDKVPPKVREVLRNFPDARIERRNGYQVLRIGRYTGYSKAIEHLGRVQNYFPDAYIRECDYRPSQIICTAAAAKQLMRREVQTKSDDSLWKVCRDCFDPACFDMN